MKILIAHNAYQQRGGEDAVVEAETALLRSAGHEVIEYRRHNDDIASMAAFEVARDTLWSRRTLAEVGALLDAEQPDVVHVHNTFALISPTLHVACARRGIPLVQTLHNFRLACAGGSFMREGRPCEQCLGRSPWPALAHGCYRGSRAQTAVLALGNVVHRRLGTQHRAVHRYVALSNFSRDKYIAMGLPADRLVVKPNFAGDPGLLVDGRRQGILFAGRLSPEKGIAVLVEAMRADPTVPVSVAGTGPLDTMVRTCRGASILGALSPEAVMKNMVTHVAVLLPSVCYEGFPRTLVEAYATATPVIASRIGALAELVQHGVTGLLVAPGDPAELAAAMRWALDNPRAMREMGQRARRRYLAEFTPAQNLPRLLQIYAEARQLARLPRIPAGYSPNHPATRG